MEAARRDLARMRESADTWQELRYEAATNGDDANEVRRAKVLWALQYDRRPQDLPLLRFLAEQEALCRSHSPHQGLGEQAALAGFLLAEHRQVEDAWRQWEIKRANFDTMLGYDVEHVLAAGVRVTIEHLRASDHPGRDQAVEYLIGADVEEERLREWARHKREWFADDPADEDPLTWFERAMLVGEEELARAELDRWARGRERDESMLRSLGFRLKELGEFGEAARVQRESLVFAAGDRDRASAWQTLAGLERQAGNHVAAWEAEILWGSRCLRPTLGGSFGSSEANLVHRSVCNRCRARKTTAVTGWWQLLAFCGDGVRSARGSAAEAAFPSRRRSLRLGVGCL